MRKCSAVNNLIDNMQDVTRLLEIHAELTGEDRGRRVGVEILNKSAVVLVAAVWEAFIEDLAVEAFDFLLDAASSSAVIPPKVRALVGRRLAKDPDETKIWNLADAGWKDELRQHKQDCLKRFVRNLNTPRRDNVDALFESMLGLRNVSSSWRWQNQNITDARARLDRYITVRGQIAHRVQTSETITKAYAQQFVDFVYRLAIKTANKVRIHVYALVGSYPWPAYTYR